MEPRVLRSKGGRYKLRVEDAKYVDVKENRRIGKAILLAAGRGTRLGSLTANKPKPMVEVGGKPVIEHIILGLKGHGIQEFLVVVHYLGEVIRDYFQDGSRLGVSLEYVHQPDMNGTGAA